MQINTYTNELVTEVITKSFSDFNTSNPLNVIQLSKGDTIVGIDVKITNHFTGPSNSESKLNIPSLISNLNITNGTQLGGSNPFVNLESSPYFIVPSAWTVSANTNDQHRDYPVSAGTQNAAVVAGGYNKLSGPNAFATTEEYNGTSWAIVSGGDLITRKYNSFGCGTQTAALTAGGMNESATLNTSEEYDGAVWSAGGNISQARWLLYGCGTQTAGLCFGGANGATNYKITEEYNGTSWSSGGSLIYESSDGLGGFGIQDSAVAISGRNPTLGWIPYSQEYDGTSWFISTPANIIVVNSGGAGTQSLGIKIGGSSPKQYVKSPINWAFVPQCETYNGTSWAMASELNVAYSRTGTAGSQAETIRFGGNPTNNTNGAVCETHTTAGYNSSIKNIMSTISKVGLRAWSSAKDMNVPRSFHAGCGTQSAGLSFGGVLYSIGTSFATTEEYDGTNWTISSNLSVATYNLAGCGTQNAGLSFGGHNGSVGVATTQEYNGFSWSAGGNLNTVRWYLAGCGLQDAGLSFGGYNGSTNLATTEEYNGASWTSGGALSIARNNLAGCGTQTAGLSFGGHTGSIFSTTTEEYNGTAWGTGGSLNTSRAGNGGCGTQVSGLTFAGTSPYLKSTEEYDGSIWAYSGDLNSYRNAVAGCGTQSAGLCFGGHDSYLTDLGTTEEYDIKTAGAEAWVSGSLQFTIKYINYSG